MLRRNGYASIASTMDPHEVCELHLKNRYDLILLDLVMPGMDGFQVMESLKEIEKDGYLPVLVITSQSEHKARALKAGAKDFVSKPFDLVEVLARVFNMLEVRLLHLKTRRLYDEGMVEQRALLTAKAEISRHAIHLEQVVLERTAQLREKIGELEVFSYSISHDMRQPLRAMQGYAQALLDDYGESFEPEPKLFLQQIKSAALRLDHLIQDVLTYSNATHGESEVSSIGLSEIVREVVENYPNLRNAKIEIDPSMAPVLGYEVALTQSISNLLANAVKFVPSGITPEIKIWSEPRDDCIRLWIQDNGIGIAPQDHKRIFEMFSRVHSNEVYEGTGIGLSIVAKSVGKMGGHLGVESELGKGSRFWIELQKAELP